MELEMMYADQSPRGENDNTPLGWFPVDFETAKSRLLDCYREWQYTEADLLAGNEVRTPFAWYRKKFNRGE